MPYHPQIYRCPLGLEQAASCLFIIEQLLVVIKRMKADLCSRIESVKSLTEPIRLKSTNSDPALAGER